MIFPSSEFLELTSSLEEHYSIFSLLWRFGKPQFTETIPTAAMKIIGTEIYFLFNPNYWKTRSFIQKKFLICHELLHIFLGHHIRIKNCLKKELANYTMDYVANQILIDSFSFIKEEVDPNNGACWIENDFGPEVPKDKSFEYYYDLLKNSKRIFNQFDVHDFDQDYRVAIGNALQSLPEDQVGHFFSTIKNDSLYRTFKIQKKKFEWPKEFQLAMKKSFLEKNKSNKTIDQWARKSRRLATISDNLFLPHPIVKSINRPNISIFIDSSASCYNRLENFFNLASSIPSDKFNAKIYSFATSVYEIKKQSDCAKIMSESGTFFSIIESFLLKSNYPDLVAVFTDGVGDLVSPKYPERWSWMLTQHAKKFIPEGSKTYLI